MSNTQIRKNLISNILSLIVNVTIGILYTPYLVKQLGIMAYGIIPLALIINQYIGIVTGSLTSALTRFYTIALQKDNNDDASKYLNTSLVVIVALVFLFLIPLWYLVENIESIFNMPSELLEDAKYMFIYTILSLFISLFSSVFNITLFASNRLDLLNVINVFRVSSKFLLVLLFFSAIDKNISYVGLASLMTEISLLFFSLWVFFRFSVKSVTLNLKRYNSTAFKAVGMMAIWTVIHQLGDLGLYRVDNLLVNMFWSSKESGILGAFEEIGNYIIMVASVFSSLFGPLILIAYSKGDHLKVKELCLDRSLSVGVFLSVIIGIIMGFSTIILKIWLNDEFIPYNSWLILKLALVPFYAAAGVFSFAARAWNKVLFPALMTVVLGSVNFVILYFLAKFSNNSLSQVQLMLFVGLIFGTIQSYFLNGLYFSKYYPGTLQMVLLNFFKILLVLISVYITCLILEPVISVLTDIWSLITIALITIVAIVVSLKFALNNRQLKAIISLVRS
jgi:membrane protein EpsK